MVYLISQVYSTITDINFILGPRDVWLRHTILHFRLNKTAWKCNKDEQISYVRVMMDYMKNVLRRMTLHFRRREQLCHRNQVEPGQNTIC